MKLDNEVTFRLDFSLRDDATSNTKLDQGTSFGTAGQKAIRIAPSIDYILNNRVSMKLYFEQADIKEFTAEDAMVIVGTVKKSMEANCWA